MIEERNIPVWEELYQQQSVEKMPWFYTGIDPDLEQGLRRWTLRLGDVLDIGTGPGTQAIALAELGFRVTGVDISEAAIKNANERCPGNGISVDFIHADILETTFDKNFDLVVDRGCFHSQHPHQREKYIHRLHQLVAPCGFLFLKCYSHEELYDQGPYRFSSDQIRELFSSYFTVQSIEETIYHGTRTPMPRALFCVLYRG